MSLARQNFSKATEDALNAQVHAELSASYVYTALAAYFGRDDVALPGFKKFFEHNAEEEREHAQKFIDYINMRGGRVSFSAIAQCEKAEWTPLQALENALALEKAVNQKLLDVHAVASDAKDPQLTDFLEENFLEEQVEAIKKLADLITNLKRVGEGLGVYLFDKNLA